MTDCLPQSGQGFPTRRNFLRKAGAAVILTGVGDWSFGAEAKQSLKAAVIGHTGRGDYGHGLESVFQNRPGIEFVVLADPDPAGRAKTAAKIGAPRSYSAYRDLLAKERPQLVSLATRHADLHHSIALDVLRAGAHLYCEKPFVTSPLEADELVTEAKQRGLKIAVAHTMRLMPSKSEPTASRTRGRVAKT